MSALRMSPVELATTFILTWATAPQDLTLFSRNPSLFIDLNPA